MNANELADYVDAREINNPHLREASAMLRQQQAEIETLKGLIEVMRMGQPNIDYEKELLKPTFVGRELTDEEIDELANKYLYVLNDVPYANDIKEFARAILRKAQEK